MVRISLSSHACEMHALTNTKKNDQFLPNPYVLNNSKNTGNFPFDFLQNFIIKLQIYSVSFSFLCSSLPFYSRFVFSR